VRDEGWRKLGEPEEVFLSRLENVFSFGARGLRRFLNVGLSRLDFSSPFACSSLSKGEGSLGSRCSARDADPRRIGRLYRLARVLAVCFVGVAVISIIKLYRLVPKCRELTSLSSFVPTDFSISGLQVQTLKPVHKA
jgi:hypothetical protein